MRSIKVFIVLSIIPITSYSDSLSTNLIEKIEVNRNRVDVIINKEFKQEYLYADFFAIYDENIDLKKIDPSILTIPCILSIISLVWESGKTYYVDCMDADLMESLKIIKEVYKGFYPSIAWNGQLIANRLVNNKNLESAKNNKEDLLAIVFSCGVDSTFSSFAYNDKKQLLITYFGFSAEINKQGWPLVRDQCKQFSKKYGNRINAFVCSNFRAFVRYNVLDNRYPHMRYWCEFCQESLSLAGLAAPILIAHHCFQLHIPSTKDGGYNYLWGSHPFIDNNIRFANVLVEVTNYSFSRQDKTLFIKNFCNDNKIAKPRLTVCRDGDFANNCCECEK